MKKNVYLLAAAALLLACSPQNEQVQDADVPVQSEPQQVRDSLADIRKDALQTDELEPDPTLPLPPPAMRQLSEKYPNWQKPVIAQEAQQKAQGYASTAAIARGDFDGDNNQDVALQLQDQNEVVLVVALQKRDNVYELVELKRDILFNDRGQLKSLYYLFANRRGNEVRNAATAEKITLAQDALSVGLNGTVSTYIYEGGSFRSFATTE